MNAAKHLTLATALAIFVCTVACGAPAFAQNQPAVPGEPAAGAPSQKQLDIAAARAERKAVVGQNMSLTPKESKAFWPLYDAYEAKMDRIEDRHIREIKDFARHFQNLTNADARRKLDEVMAISRARLKVQSAYIPKFRAILSDVKVTRFFQIDNKLRALVQCQIAQMVPLAEPSAASESGGHDM